MGWRPRPRVGVEPGVLRLSPLELHVLRRLDGQQELEGLPGLTGLALGRVEEIVARLVQAGAVQPEEGGAPTAGGGLVPAEAGAPAPALPTVASGAGEAAAATGSGAAWREEPDLDEAWEDDPAAPAGEETTDEVPAHVPKESPVDPMALYARELAPLALEERVQRAPGAGAAELSALCFDPSARVIAAVLENPRCGLPQARLIARHHRDAQGLERLLATAAFAADAVVRQELLRNPQLQVPMLRRLWGGKRALELWKASASREATEQARAALKELFRGRFGAAEAEERVEVIVKTDGRCLPLLSTVPLDGRTLAQLCARSYTSPLLVQHLARWGATPTALLAHLLRQPLVRQQKPLRVLVLQHPNAPSGA